VEIFDCLRAANGGTLSGFFDVFAWREPGRAGFFEAKVGPDRTACLAGFDPERYPGFDRLGGQAPAEAGAQSPISP